MGLHGLTEFAQRAARAQSVAELGSTVIDFGGELLGARYSGLGAPAAGRLEPHTNLPAALVDRYGQFALRVDPVLATVRERHVPCATPIRDLRRWARAQGQLEYLELLDYSIGRHYLIAPVALDGEVVGVLQFARGEDRAFGAGELRVAAAISLHVSTRLAAMRALERGVSESWADVLTPRGLEIAELAARGLTNAEMGRALGVSPNTVKKHLRAIYERLAVSTRAELAMLLASR